eukprot:746263-Rhodomonas_salina.2
MKREKASVRMQTVLKKGEFALDFAYLAPHFTFSLKQFHGFASNEAELVLAFGVSRPLSRFPALPSGFPRAVSRHPPKNSRVPAINSGFPCAVSHYSTCSACSSSSRLPPLSPTPSPTSPTRSGPPPT